MSAELELAKSLGLVAVAVGVMYFVWRNSARQKKRREVDATTTMAIKQVPGGVVVKVAGRVEKHEKVLRAPLSRRRCVAWRVQVFGTGKHGRDYGALVKPEIDEVRAVDFRLDDGSGVAHVVGKGAELELVEDRNLTSHFMKEATPEMKKFLARHEQRAQGELFNRSLRYKESVLELGEEAVVVGLALRDFGSSELKLAKSPDHGLFISDDPSLSPGGGSA
jgi:hypothetical protein